MQLVEQTFKGRKKFTVCGYTGLTVDFCREINAQVIVRGLRVFSDFEYEFRLALANAELAPKIETISLITSKEHTFLSSSTVREISSLGGDVSSMVPKHVYKALVAKFSDMDDKHMEYATNALRD